MTADELAEAARQLVERTTTAQGLPLTIDDDGALRRVAAIIVSSKRETTPARNRGRLNRSATSTTRQALAADA